MGKNVFKKTFAKIVLGLYLSYQLMFSLWTVPFVYAVDYGTITDSTTITEDSITEYAFFTGENQTLEISGVTLDVTGYVDGYVGYTDYPVISGAIVLDGSGDKLVFDSGTGNLNGNGVIISGSNNEFDVINSSAYYPIFLYGNNNKLDVNGGKRFQEMFVRGTGHSIVASGGYAPRRITLNENASADISLSNLVSRDLQWGYTIQYDLMLQTGSNVNLDYVGNLSADIYLQSGASIVINGTDYTNNVVDCELVENWCQFPNLKVLKIVDGQVVAGLNNLEITGSGDYNFDIEKGKFNLVTSSYTGSDAVLNLSNTSFTGQFSKIILSGDNKINLNGESFSLSSEYGRNKIDNVLVGEYGELYNKISLSATNFIHINDGGRYFCSVDINSPKVDIADWTSGSCGSNNFDRNLKTDEIVISNRGYGHDITSISPLNYSILLTIQQPDTHFHIDNISKDLYLSGDGVMYIYSGGDLLLTGDNTSVYYCDDNFTFNSDDCTPPTPLFYGSGNFNLTEYTGNNHKLIVTDIKPELVKVGEITANEDDLLTGFNLKLISQNGEEDKLLTGSWNFSGYTTLPIYVKIGNVSDIPSPAIVYDVATGTGDMKFISHNVGPFVWGTKQNLDIQTINTKIQVIDNNGGDLGAIDYQVDISKDLHGEQFVNSYTQFTSGEQIAFVESGNVQAVFSQDYWFRVKPDVNHSPFVQKTNNVVVQQLFDTGANLTIISGDVVEAYSNDIELGYIYSIDKTNVLAGLLSEYNTGSVYTPYFTDLARVGVSSNSIVSNYEQLNYLNSSGVISSSEVIAPVFDLAPNYAFVELTGADTSSYTKSNINIQITTDADNADEVINTVKNGIAINIYTGDVTQTYITNGYTGDFEVFNGTGLLLAPIYSGNICPDGFQKGNWLPLSGTGDYCLKPVVVNGDASYTINYTTKVYYPLYLHIDEEQVDPITGINYEIKVGNNIYTGVGANDGHTLVSDSVLAGLPIDYVKVYSDKFDDYNILSIKYYSDINTGGKDIFNNNINITQTGFELNSLTNGYINATGSIDLLLRNTLYTGNILLTGDISTGDDIVSYEYNDVNGYHTGSLNNGNYSLNYKSDKLNSGIKLTLLTTGVVEGNNNLEKYVFQRYGINLSGAYYSSSLSTYDENYDYSKISIYFTGSDVEIKKNTNIGVYKIILPYSLHVWDFSGQNVELANEYGEINPAYVKIKETDGELGVIFSGVNIENYNCSGDWSSITGENNNLICKKSFVNSGLFNEDIIEFKDVNYPSFVLSSNEAYTGSDLYTGSELTGNVVLKSLSGDVFVNLITGLSLTGVNKNIHISGVKKTSQATITLNSTKKLNTKLSIAITTNYTGSVTFNTGVDVCIKTENPSINNLKIYYTIDGSSWNYDEYATSTLRTEKSYICFKTTHFTEFALGEEETTSTSSGGGSSGGSSSSHSGGGGGGGGGSYYSANTSKAINKKTNTNKNSVVNKTILSLEQAKKELNIKFKTKKYIRIANVLNKLIFTKLETAQLLGNKLFSDLVNSYKIFLLALKDYESKKIIKAELKNKIKPFLRVYQQYNNSVKKIIKKEKENIKGIKVVNYEINYKNPKVNKLVKVLDKLIKKELSKSKYTLEDVKGFYKDYNNFKLAIRYMKEVNKTEGKKLAKKYLKKLIIILKK